MNKTWLIGDPHFGHENVISYCERPFSSVTEMDEEIIKRWNNLVKKNDEVILLGDFSFYGREKSRNILSRLHGTKTLIKGNHDTKSDKYYRDIGFRNASKYPIVVRQGIILSHQPMFGLFSNDSILMNIYAHEHNNKEFEDFTNCSACVSVERTNYEPVLLDEIESKILEIRRKK